MVTDRHIDLATEDTEGDIPAKEKITDRLNPAKKNTGRSKLTKKKRGKAVKKKRGMPATQVVSEMPIVAPTMRCSRCHREVDKMRVQVTGKCASVVRCNACNTRAVQLSRMPTWAGFQTRLKSLPDEEKALFWQGACDAPSGAGLSEFLSEQTSLLSRHSETTSSFVSGEYLPLSVYAAKGYDADRIRMFCKDSKEDPVLGLVYRLPVHGHSETAQVSRVKEERLDKGKSNGSGNGGAASSGRAAPPLADSGAAAVKAEDPAFLAKKEARELKALQGLASRILGKVAFVMPALSIQLKSKLASTLPSVVKDNAQGVLDELVELEAACKKTLRGAPALTTTMQDATNMATWPDIGVLGFVATHMHYWGVACLMRRSPMSSSGERCKPLVCAIRAASHGFMRPRSKRGEGEARDLAAQLVVDHVGRHEEVGEVSHRCAGCHAGGERMVLSRLASRPRPDKSARLRLCRGERGRGIDG